MAQSLTLRGLCWAGAELCSQINGVDIMLKRVFEK